jgi:hypothetical protein
LGKDGSVCLRLRLKQKQKQLLRRGEIWESNERLDLRLSLVVSIIIKSNEAKVELSRWTPDQGQRQYLLISSSLAGRIGTDASLLSSPALRRVKIVCYRMAICCSKRSVLDPPGRVSLLGGFVIQVAKYRE